MNPRLKYDEERSGDFHAWVENDKGDIIYDPSFRDYVTIIRFHGTTAKRVYVKWTKEEQIKQLKHLMRTHGECFLMVKSNPEDLIKNPIFGQCIFNALAYKTINGGKVVIGSMGFRRADGNVWWEYG